MSLWLACVFRKLIGMAVGWPIGSAVSVGFAILSFYLVVHIIGEMCCYI